MCKCKWFTLTLDLHTGYWHLHAQHWYAQSKDILMNLSMKCWYSAFNAQGSRLIIVVVQLGAVKIYVAAVEALRKKERQDETEFTTKNDGFLSFIPRWMLMYFFAGFFFNLTLCMAKLRVLVLCFSYFTDISIIFKLPNHVPHLVVPWSFLDFVHHVHLFQHARPTG